MKNNALILLLLIVILVFSDKQVFGQIPWTKDPNNPVLSGGASGSWNQHVFWPCVIYNADSARYEMWFSANNNPPFTRPLRIGFAYSQDGIDWTMHPDPVLEPDAGTWDETSAEQARVIRENGQYKMWYVGWSPQNEVGGIGYATSPDGINWAKYPENPVMEPDSAAWQAGEVIAAQVVPFEGGYKMWYTGFNADWSNSDIGYATSPDGISWTPDSLNPVLTTGIPGRWDDGNLLAPNVLIDSNAVYHMWYSGSRPSEGVPVQTGWATSADGIDWNKYNNPSTTSTLYLDSDPVLTPSSGQWDGTFVHHGSVIREGDSLRMWYSGSRFPISTNLLRIGHATAPYDTSIFPLPSGIKGYEITHIPEEYSLRQNYPNPFNPTTKITFSQPKSKHVTLDVYNTLGQKVSTLIDTKKSAGSHDVTFNATVLPSGIYFYRIQAGEFSQVKKMVLLR